MQIKKTVFLLHFRPHQGTHRGTLYRLPIPVEAAAVAGTKPQILFRVIAHLTPQMSAAGPHRLHPIVSLPQPKAGLT
ncbi:hypothetical protein [Desulfosporosinus sp. I2]|uniref:hypothetical protein n=1 Tax=Desulfosporosinus sp. I2 TaxID=1617025 RepID=UPI001FA80E86|nr:hypothetical protein [Desulfosporosinus sp. I2]